MRIKFQIATEERCNGLLAIGWVSWTAGDKVDTVTGTHCPDLRWDDVDPTTLVQSAAWTNRSRTIEETIQRPPGFRGEMGIVWRESDVTEAGVADSGRMEGQLGLDPHPAPLPATVVANQFTALTAMADIFQSTINEKKNQKTEAYIIL